MDFTGSELEIHTVQDFEIFVRNLGMKVSNRKDKGVAYVEGKAGVKGLIENDSHLNES